ncbi:MAG: glycine oxidase ThiO [Merismopedia sp. SIO2A8]|nr:glycine oxidase ThiO [Merismopedia sp. SIO2A8]
MTTGSDILIIGGGVIGLAIAIELTQCGSSVTVLTRDRKEAATQAAAGMLAPQAEALPPGPLLDLGLKSLSLYPNWVQTLEDIAGTPTHYWPCGILAPCYTSSASSAVTGSHSPTCQWFSSSTLQHVQPNLDPAITGAWWYPEEGQVDPRSLAKTLYTAAIALGVTIHDGITVEAFQQSHGRIAAVQTSKGKWQAGHYVLATGAWSTSLLPIPVHPIKGQLLAVQTPETAVPLNHVLYGPGIYIVPRQNGRIVIGATSESVGFTPHNTPAGLQTLMNKAIQLYPGLSQFPIEEQWWGFRPATPDEWPILGASHCDNLTLATGHHRNGILLAPATARLITDHILDSGPGSPLLEAFHWRRFELNGKAWSEKDVGEVNQRPTHGDPVANPHCPTLDFPPPPPQLQRSTLNTQSPTLDPQNPKPKIQNPKSEMLQTLSQPLSTVAHSSANNSNSAGSGNDFILQDSPLTIAGRTFRSRLMTGTGKYRTFDDMRHSIAASGCEIITVAVRRVQTNAPGHEGLAEALDWTRLWMLPNTAGCKTAEDAIRVARLGREMAKLLGQEDNHFVKLEVIPDAKYLLPDPIGTLEAAEQLVKEGFAVLPYINADPLLAKRLEEVGCATVMPLGSPIGSGQGIRNAANIQIIVENANIPVVVDAGIGTPSEAAQAMEMGADALLINTAIAQASNPASMGRAMGLAAEAGRLAYLSGRIPVKAYASASSPLTGTISS